MSEEKRQYQLTKNEGMESKNEVKNSKTVMFTARIKEEDKELFQKLTEEMGEGITQAQAFGRMLRSQNVIKELGDIDKDSKNQVVALQVHINKIVDIFSSMVQNYKTISEDTKEKYLNEITKKADEINNLKKEKTEIEDKIKALQEDNKVLQESIAELKNLTSTQEKAINDKEEIVKARNHSIANLQEKLDELISLEEENKKLIVDIEEKENEIKSLNEKTNELDKKLEKEKEERMKEKEGQKNALLKVEEKYHDEISMQAEKMALEKDKAVLKVKENHQDEINKIHNEYQKRQQNFYNKIEEKDNLINHLNEKIEQLKEEKNNHPI